MVYGNDPHARHMVTVGAQWRGLQWCRSGISNGALYVTWLEPLRASQPIKHGMVYIPRDVISI